MSDRIMYEDDSQDKTPRTENGWRISYAKPIWQAVKNGKVGFSHKSQKEVVIWARAHN